jgi:hypothetical protein
MPLTGANFSNPDATGFVNLIWPTFDTLIWPTPWKTIFMT